MVPLLLLLAAGCALAGEQVVLRTGFTIAAERHEVLDGRLRLYTNGGAIELPLEAVAGIEAVGAEPALEPAPALSPAPTADPRLLVDQAADKWGLPRELLHGVARVESGYRADAVSRKGALGIMQLMPETAARLGADARDAAQNVDAGARHLRELLILYGGQTGKALAAYNAGAGAVERYGGVPPYRETIDYVQKVLRQYWLLKQQRAEP